MVSFLSFFFFFISALNSDVEEEKNLTDDELLPKTQEHADHLKEKTEGDEGEETPSQWVAFSDPAPFIVKARFNITEIELPPSDTNEIGNQTDHENQDGGFLQMLIEEGIPVNYTKDEQPSQEEPSNVGIILPPSNPIAEETLNLVPQSLEIKDADSEEPTNNVENIVEVTGCSKPISKPLFLHLVPSLASLQEGVIAPSTPDFNTRRGSTDPSIIMIPAAIQTLPVKKKVRFDLPGRKASLIGEYEILKKPVPSYSKKAKEKNKFHCKFFEF